VRIGKSGT